jgi:hypothetical protein
VKIKSRDEILEEIMIKAGKKPKGWRAIVGRDERLFSNDYYILHPDIGLYLIKEYQKNPFVARGIGGRIARKVDEDIEEAIGKKSGEFGIIRENPYKILKNLKTGIPLHKIFEEGLSGGDMGVQIPVRGSAHLSHASFSQLKKALPEERRVLNAKFEKLLEKDGIYRAYE